jgi:rubrerythrin
MPDEQEKIITALKYAIQMEIDGQAFYLAASQKSSNELGRKMLETCARQEEYHRLKFEEIYETIRKSEVFPVVDFQTDGGKSLRTIFAREMKKPAFNITVMKTEPEAILKAMEMEDKSQDYYRARSVQAVSGAEKSFYTAVADEEREHKLVLTDYYEYLKDPVAWFVKAEHHSLDGG